MTTPFFTGHLVSTRNENTDLDVHHFPTFYCPWSQLGSHVSAQPEPAADLFVCCRLISRVQLPVLPVKTLPIRLTGFLIHECCANLIVTNLVAI